MVSWNRSAPTPDRAADGRESAASTAQELFNDMLKEALWPRLREVGFRGSGTTFTWPAEDAWVMIGLQKSSGNTGDSVKFTANVSVTTHAEWEKKRLDQSYLGEKPSPNVHPWGWGMRIGHLMPVQQDYWWILRTGDDRTPTARELLDTIEHLALPRMLLELEAKR